MVVVLLIAGDHVPVTPLSEVRGNAGMAAPEQYSLVVTEAKLGVNLSVISISNVVVIAHSLDVGVNV